MKELRIWRSITESFLICLYTMAMPSRWSMMCDSERHCIVTRRTISHRGIPIASSSVIIWLIPETLTRFLLVVHRIPISAPRGFGSRTGRMIAFGRNTEIHLSPIVFVADTQGISQTHVTKKQPLRANHAPKSSRGIRPSNTTCAYQMAGSTVSNSQHFRNARSGGLARDFMDAASAITETTEQTTASTALVPHLAATLPDPRIVITPLDPIKVEEVLCTYNLLDDWSHIVFGLRYGFDVGVREHLSHSIIPPNHNSSNIDPDFIDSYIASEETAGRYSMGYLPDELECIIGPFRYTRTTFLLPGELSIKQQP
ncbi:hypothetical protein MSAN_02249700 [Mycena sanguinolenta]|uniref:Uncharacterized protein n=1 Tax=Mycena sanguinolenta TaxID=230812 RepID=A0A8H6XC45_9AGAR|nr:hypothetical protein MSAN_02249700 [Mycena sanguinolenta]